MRELDHIDVEAITEMACEGCKGLAYFCDDQGEFCDEWARVRDEYLADPDPESTWGDMECHRRREEP